MDETDATSTPKSDDPVVNDTPKVELSPPIPTKNEQAISSDTTPVKTPETTKSAPQPTLTSDDLDNKNQPPKGDSESPTTGPPSVPPVSMPAESEPTPEKTKEPQPIPSSDGSATQAKSPKRDPGSSTTGPEPTPTKAKEPEIKIPFDPSTLSLDELRAAHRLYTKRMQKEFSKKGVAKRQRTMELNLREIIDFLSTNNGSPLPRISKHTNITPGTTSKYLRQLIASGKVRAEGWGKTRRYYLK